MNWDEFWIHHAELTSQKSKDQSTKVGCVIVGEGNTLLSIGFNGFPRGVDESLDERWIRPVKYEFVEHSERNAVYNAARNGIRLFGAKAYLNYEPNGVCTDCARALIQAGITEIIGPNRLFSGKGVGIHYQVDNSNTMLSESGIKLRIVEFKVPFWL